MNENATATQESSLTTEELLDYTVHIVSQFAGTNGATPDSIVKLIGSTFEASKNVSATTAATEVVELKPAVPVKKSITPDYIVCLEDGKKMKMLKRHLMSSFGLTPDQYRAKWGLPSDYPMVAPNYAKARSDLAVKLGLGRRSTDEKAAA